MQRKGPLSRWVCLGLLVLGCTGKSEDRRREEVVRRYIDAVNTNDVRRALSYHTRTARFLIPGQDTIVGTDAMRALLQWDSVLGSEIRFDDGEWSGDTLVLGGGTERNAWFRGVGLDSVHYAPGTRFVFEGDLINGVYPAALAQPWADEFATKVGAFMTWADGNAPEVADLAPGGRFKYDGESARRWLVVLERYGRHLAEALDSLGAG